MKKIHISFFTNETRAHTSATFALASELMRRGYRVSYATTEHLAPDVIQLGAEAAIYKSLELHKQPTQPFTEELDPHDPKNWDMMMTVVVPFGISTGINALSQIAGFYNQNPPDLIIYDPDAYAGRFLAAARGIQAIQTSCYFAFYNKFYSRENCSWLNPAPPDSVYDRLNLFYSLAFPIEKLNIFTIPKAFQVNADSLDERFFFSGPCVRDPSAEKNQSVEKNTDRPTILVSRSASTSQLSSDYDYFKTFIDALSNSNHNVILCIGDNLDPEKLGPLPRNFKIIQKTPQHEIIPSASIFIGSGGTVSTFEALYHGIPVILIPQDIFHAEFSHRISEFGLGVTIEKTKLNIDSIRDAVSRVSTSHQIINNVKKMQKTIKNENAPKTIADIIEQYLKKNKK